MTKPDPTDPGAVTHEEARGAVAGMAEASGWMAVGRKLERYIDQQQASGNALNYWSTRARELDETRATLSAQLAAVTTRAEAAEAECESLQRGLASSAQHHDEHHERDDKRWALAQEALGLHAAWPALFDRMRQLVGKEAELVHLREAAELLRDGTDVIFTVETKQTFRDAVAAWLKRDQSRQPLPSTRLDGGKVTAVEGEDSACSCGAGMTEVGGNHAPNCGVYDGDETADPPPEPAPAGFARRPRPGECVDCLHPLHEGPCAPQPAAAPKVLPVEELRREIVEALRESASQPLVFGAMLRDMADRLERGSKEPR